MSGVALAASAHAERFEQAVRRPGLERLMEARAFERVVVPFGPWPGRVEAILDGEGRA